MHVWRRTNRVQFIPDLEQTTRQDQMATPSKHIKLESKYVDFNRRAEEPQCAIEWLETTVCP